MSVEYDLNIVANRRATKYPAGVLLRRVLWSGCTPLFRYSPRIFFGWRNLLIRLFGGKVGRRVHIYNSAIIYMPWNLEIGDFSSIGEYAFIYNLGRITIGAKTTISHRTHLCAGSHDYTRAELPLIKPPILIGDKVWVCTDAYVGPGVSVGEGSVVGARALERPL